MVKEEKWTPIESMKTRQIYDNLIKKRLRAKNYTPKRAHENVRKIQRNLKAKERDYWWRLTHKLIITKKRESKYNPVTNKCPVCKTEVEDFEHYEYECNTIQQFVVMVAREAKKTEISKEEWKLEEKGMTTELMTLIAKARWIYHCERCQIDLGRRRTVNLETLMNRLIFQMTLLKESKQGGGEST